MRIYRSARSDYARRLYLPTLAFVVGMLVGVSAAAEVVPSPTDDSATPASPELGRVPVSAQFRFPDDFDPRNEKTTIICQVLVGANGSVSERKCAQHGGSDRMRAWLRNETHHRMKRARFRPAEVDGEAVAVSMPVRIVASCDGEADCGVDVYPNSGQYASEWGNAYYAPQEIIEDAGTWYDRLVASDACRAGRDTACKDLTAFAFGAAVKVGANGLVTGVGLLAGAEPGDFPVDAAFARLAESRFIAARVQGAPAELLIHTPTIHSRGNKHFRRTQCRDVEEIGTRLGRDCYTMQAYAALRPDDDPNSFAENLEFWLVN
jgi:hypothetical protein